MDSRLSTGPKARPTNTSIWRAVPRRTSFAISPAAMTGASFPKRCWVGSWPTAFLNGEPERFNYIPKRDVPDRFRGAARVLDNICLRVNSGFYLGGGDGEILHNKRLRNWLTYQGEDRNEGHRGRWILDERILDTLRADALKLAPDAASAPSRSQSSLLRDVFSPVIELGVSRDHLKYLPGKE